MINKVYIAILTMLLTSLACTAQFTLDGEFRPRAEYRHGYGNIIADAAEPGFGISTRARLNFAYQLESYKFYLSLQDVLTWGENRQLQSQDTNNSFSIFQAWADINVGSGWSTKIGRQTIIYDDQRIFGAVGWAQQARNHDAAIIKYKKEKFMFDLGLAFNQDGSGASGFSSVENTFNTSGFFTYKTMFYGYAKKEWESITGSLLVLTNGFQDEATTGSTDVSYLTTVGTHLAYKKGKFGLASNIYVQGGKRIGEIEVKGAYLASLDLNYKASAKIGLGIGAEIITGNDKEAGETGAFFPLYGTNHKFNGFMDYYYVGNHANSIGLVDVHASAVYKFKNKASLLIKVLYFSGEQELPSGTKSLGTELDIVFTKPFKAGKLQIGYSEMFASDGLYELKGTTKDAAASVQNWAWIQLTLTPKFLNATN